MQMVLDVGAENNRTSSVSTVQRAAHDDDDDQDEADDVVDVNHDDHDDESNDDHRESGVDSIAVPLFTNKGWQCYLAFTCTNTLGSFFV